MLDNPEIVEESICPVCLEPSNGMRGKCIAEINDDFKEDND